MQTFVYTLFCIDSGIFNTPLSLLVSRENPLPENSSWRIRNAIFTRKIEEETRLILFWDIKNMKEMVDNIRKDTDPFAILKREIRSFGTRIWNGG